jgi:hypothetical protein
MGSQWSQDLYIKACRFAAAAQALELLVAPSTNNSKISISRLESLEVLLLVSIQK